MNLRLGLSPCPNDTYIFHALLHGLVDTRGVTFDPVIEDVERLNERMLMGELEVTKASFAAFAHARHRYRAIRTGAALGRGNGPLVVSREPLGPEDLTGCRVLLPGRFTTAALLFHSFHPEVTDTPSDRYDRLLPRLLYGEADAAVLIHETRFTYKGRGLRRVEDLGMRFEVQTGMPVPLGGVFVRNDVDPDVALSVERWIGASLAHAHARPGDSREYIRAHAQELDDEVTAAHIRTYVNEFSTDVGTQGMEAIGRLLEMAVASGAAPASSGQIFV